MADDRLTGRERALKNRRSVQFADTVSRALITVGGVGTILSVSSVCVFLLWVVIPLFTDASVESESSVPVRSSRPLVHLSLGEFAKMSWTVDQSGVLSVRRLDSGKELSTKRLFPETPTLTAASFPVEGKNVAFAFADGSVRLGEVGFESRFLEPNELTPALRALEVGGFAEIEGGLVTKTPERQYRLQTFGSVLQEPIDPESALPIRLLDLTVNEVGPAFVTWSQDNTLRVVTAEKRSSMLDDTVSYETTVTPLPFDYRDDPPSFLRISEQGDQVFVAWRDGRLVRYDLRDLESPKVAEILDLTEDGVELTRLDFLLGRNTLLAGDSTGRVRAWFTAKPSTGASRVDGRLLVNAHTFPGDGSPVTWIASSSRSRILLSGHANGRVRMVHVTSGAEILDKRIGDDSGGQNVAIAAINPRGNLVAAVTESGELHAATLDPRHPEATVAALFRPIWYEGYAAPQHMWQSSSGTDDFEEKLGLWPLIFGTLKATLYSLFFGVPIALLAALYTSEFLAPRVRNAIKPTIELMASLPSVVLGFLAGLVFAPFVEDFVPAVLAGCATIPIAFLIGAYLWQLLPQPWTLRFAGLRFVCICVALPLGVLAGIGAGPIVEKFLFAGDIMLWLDGQRGSGTGGWFLILLPLSAVAVLLFVASGVNPWMRRVTAAMPRRKCAVLDFVKFGTAVVATGTVALGAATLLTAVGFDPRGGVVDTYVQRNALIVGFVMGFAVIPIIYTIAEDALSSIPEHLRSASLGAGATKWQTATRIVVPTAMSGLFSAVMIGLGRAVGETMIVLMAAGNTPVLDLNIFNGFRTLSANIAVELPEAVQNSTHYRTLFLAALTLFAITFALNTVAELIRLRFRKRSHEL